MADVAVVGGGLGGLATAARLAKLGHSVTVLERGDHPGGLLQVLRDGDNCWDAVPFQTTIPAVLRDLFRKSGRPLERYVELELSTPARRHVFTDGTVLDLPTGSRAAQLDAVSDALGASAGAAWTRMVDDQADLWSLLRSEVLDPVDGARRLTRSRLARRLHARKSLDRLLRRAFDDVRLRELTAYPVVRTGGRVDDEPAFRSVASYVERTFGVWRACGGAGALADALMRRMEERCVDVRFGTKVSSLLTTGDRITGVSTDDGAVVAAEIVVAAVSPRQVFGRLLDRGLSTGSADFLRATPAGRLVVRTHLGLSAPGPPLPSETVLHGDPLVVVNTGPGGHPESRAWTVTAYGTSEGDVVETMCQRGIDLRSLIATRRDRSATTAPRWRGLGVAAARAALARPLPGLHCLGTALPLGSSVPHVAWQAAHVAEIIGKA